MNEGRIDLCQFVALTSTNAAKMYGLYPRKGSIAIGADADLAIWDANREVTIANDILHHNVDYTPYEGMRVRGWPVTTVSRGEVVWADGEFPRPPGAASSFAAIPPSPFPRRRRPDPCVGLVTPPRRSGSPRLKAAGKQCAFLVQYLP